MAFSTKYRLQWKDRNDVAWALLIQQDPWAGAITDLTPAADACKIIYENIGDDVLKPIRASFCEFGIIITDTGVFSPEDLYTENDRTYKVIVQKAGSDYWLGWYIPDITQLPYQATPYEARFKATDGLSGLSAIRYDNNGSDYTGKQTMLDVIGNCLNKISLGINIRTGVNVYETAMATTASDDPLDLCQGNVDRFRETNGENLFSYDVLEGVLRMFTAIVFQKDGVWHVYRINEMVSNSIRTRLYNSSLVYQSASTIDLDFDIANSGADAGYINADQFITIRRGEKEVKVYYEYGFNASLLTGGNFATWNGTDFNDWTRNGGITISQAGTGTVLDPYKCNIDGSSTSSAASDTVYLEHDSISVNADEVLTFSGFFENFECFGLKAMLFLDTGTTDYWWNGTTWATSAAFFVVSNIYRDRTTGDILPQGTFKQFSETTDAVPLAGNLKVRLYRPSPVTPPLGGENIDIWQLSLSVSEPGQDSQNAIGEIHQFKQNGTYTSKYDYDKIFFGDSVFDSRLGTLFLTDIGETPTATWARFGVTEAFPLLRILVQSIANIYQSPRRMFEGSINTSALSLASRINIANLTANPLILLGLEIDCRQAITKIFCMEATNTDVAGTYFFTYKLPEQ